MKSGKERAVPLNEQNQLFSSKGAFPGYSSIVEVVKHSTCLPISHRRNLLALRNAMIEQTQLYAIAGDVITHRTVILVEKARAEDGFIFIRKIHSTEDQATISFLFIIRTRRDLQMMKAKNVRK